MKIKSVKEYVDELQSIGRYSFGKMEVIKNLNLSREAIKSALRRLVEKGRIALIRKGFYVIIPLEYQKSGIIPATWFIDQLMAFLAQPYYVGLLSAAALYGAAHQQPQEFHVVVKKQIQPIQSHGIRIRFFKKNSLDWKKGLNKIKTETGYIDVSSPELTALDLMRYNLQAGGMNFVATVLAELSEQMKAEKLLEAAKGEKSPAYIQRLGYILDWLNNEKLTSKLYQWFSSQKSNCTVLVPALPLKNALFYKKWNIFVNKELELDEL
jgi:predicted transcriptional regulator of viral defense system